MNYLNIIHQDVANGPGLRVTLFVSGCGHRCKGCHNPQSWDANAGQPFTLDTLLTLIDDLQQDWCDGLTISGGDPLYGPNCWQVIEICKYVKKHFPKKTIVIYTGFKLKQVKHLVKYADYVIDGKFEIDKRDVTLKWRGSSNQHIWKKCWWGWKKVA